MTVLTQYAPEKFTSGSSLAFTFDNLGNFNVEVWWEVILTTDPNTYLRRQLTPSEYSLVFTAEGPSYRGGTVNLNRDIPFGVQLSVERNTLISQTAILPASGMFHMDTIEFMADKLTMIIQEIGQRKCLSDLIDDGVTQDLEFNPYRVLYLGSVDFVLDKLTAYCLQMDDSIYGGDCFDDPDGT